jgi:hypothetical protein
MPRKNRRTQKRKYKQKRRNTKKQKGGNKTVDIVIARYKEKYHWFNEFKDRGFRTVHIYNKSEEEATCPTFKTGSHTQCKIHKLKNVGVCDHTYLYHIIHNWNNLADITIFTPGSADLPNKIDILHNTINNAFKTMNTVMTVVNFDISARDAMYNFVMPEYFTSHMDNKSSSGNLSHALAKIRPFGAWYAAHFPKEQLKVATFFGIMAVSREHIHRRPKSFYENLIKEVNTQKFHEASHFIERAYPAIFGPISPESIHTSAIMKQKVDDFHGERFRRQTGGGNLKFAVMGIFKNEAMGIREWVDHYKWQGVDEILLLDNASTDGGADLVKNIEHVTVLSAPDQHAQHANYNKIGFPWLKQHSVDVLAILDLDEYMFGTDGKNLKEHILEIFDTPSPPSQFSVNWTMFGSSGYEKQPASIRKSFTWRKKDLHVDVKSVMLFKNVTDCNSKPTSKLGEVWCGLWLHNSDVSGNTITNPPGIQLNHYAIQSKEFFEKVKMARGAADVTENVRDWEYFKRYDWKEQEDTQLKKLVEASEIKAP